MFRNKHVVNSSLTIIYRRSSFFGWWKNDNVVQGLKEIYKTKLLPLEERHQFHDFHSARLNDADFEAKPLVLLMGQYSTGKTTLIRYILGTDFPGMRIGPEPTTDRFMAIMYDEKTGVIPGNALVVDPNKPFAPLAKYGNAFLTKFQCSTLKNQILQGLTLVDTPGILSGEKQRVDRGYDFTGVLHWFAERVDKIILLFDAHKLDISDEFKRSIEALDGHYEKVLILLNKADMVDHQSLMRIYGSLMWSLDKVLNTPEVPKVFVGSFWDKPLKSGPNRQLFEDEEHDLFSEIQYLPSNAALRKLNDLSKRARLVRVHAYIIDELRKSMPAVFGKEEAKKKLIENLKSIFDKLQNDLLIPPGDFPDVKTMQDLLRNHDFTTFRRLDKSLIKAVDEMLAVDIAKMMTMIPDEEAVSQIQFKVGALAQMSDRSSPFSYKFDEGFNAGRGESGWIVELHRPKWDVLFAELNPDENGKLKRADVKGEFLKSKLPNSVLSKIYILADVDDDGLLDIEEFALANYMIDLTLQGYDLPEQIPRHLIPPSKRHAEVETGNGRLP